MRLELVLGASECSGADAPLLASVNSARIRLVPLQGETVAFAPGSYVLELHARARDAEFAPRIVAEMFDGTSDAVDLAQDELTLWRGTIVPRKAVKCFVLEPRCSAEFLFGWISVATQSDHPQEKTDLRQAFVGLLRAAFAELPLTWRRWILSSRARRHFLGQFNQRRYLQASGFAESGQFIVGHDDALALRADFENRFAVAKRLRMAAPASSLEDAPTDAAAKLIAFYLPQFHPTPENDLWWGRGFTEWTNVSKAVPQFVGHSQPRLPGELGFYDLRTPGVIKSQAALAKAHGISAFCFHYYWFAGRRLLDAPIEAFLSDKSIDIQFCLCWANENWTRRWDGEESEVLIEQSHSIADHKNVFDDIARHMLDPRYLQVDGKPTLVVYRPDIIDDCLTMTELWRSEARRRGWPGLYLIATNAFGIEDASVFGFDALSEFPPHGIIADDISSSLQWINRAHRGAVYSYAAVAADQSRRLRSTNAQFMPGVMPSWDNEARRPGSGVVYHGATVEEYGVWLAAAIDYAVRVLPPSRRLVFINAWNEWAEGAYLEPDRENGRALLETTARVVGALGTQKNAEFSS